MIVGYAGDFSVLPGHALDLHFSADMDGRHARVHFYRWGVSGTAAARWIHVGASGSIVFDHFPRGAHDKSWGWPSWVWPVPATWRSGVYVVLALDENVDGKKIDPETRRLEQVLFVVKSAAPGVNARILYKVPFLTYVAYNGAQLGDGNIGQTSLYQTGPVTIFRPGIGTDPWDNDYVDYEDTASPRQTFAHWDARMIAWLQRRKYAIDYCTDLDLHHDATLANKYCLLLSVGHDEYWTEEMRTHVEAFINAGGNAAFFSGNTAWWRTTVTEGNGDVIVARIDNWPPTNLETRLTGVSYRHGSGKWSGGRRDAVGFTVQQANHWVYDQAGLVDGDVFGADDRLVGYECCGTALLPEMIGQPRVPSFVDGSPMTFIVLGVAKTPGWDEPQKDNVATMGVYAQGGIVFTAASTDWARVLDAGHVAVGRITRNVLDRLAAAPIQIAGPVVAGACDPKVVAVGGEATFYVVSAPPGATFAWSVAGGTIVGAADKTKVIVEMPPTSDLVTVSVTVIAQGATCPAFGTLSLWPLSRQDYFWVQMICYLRRLIIGTMHGKKAHGGVRDKVPFLVDPLWDPVPDGVFRLTTPELRQVRRDAVALVAAIDRALPRPSAPRAKKTRARRKSRRRR